MNTELLLKVRERILAEPGRLDMEYWCSRTGKKFLGLHICRSVCCIGGHAVELAGGSAKRLQEHEYSDEIAAAALGLSEDEAEMLFYFDRSLYQPYADLFCEITALDPRTPAYALVVAKAIDRCIARNSAPTAEDQRMAHEMGVALA